jgi:hypothetical protein
MDKVKVWHTGMTWFEFETDRDVLPIIEEFNMNENVIGGYNHEGNTWRVLTTKDVFMTILDRLG